MSDRKTVFVTGAGGFIGGRIVEVLEHLDLADVRPGLRRWSSGARIGRYPLEMVKCDIRKQDDVRAALEGVTHIVHCAVGDRETTVEGTRVLLEGALEAGVERVVHISTIAVYGSPEGEIDETHSTDASDSEYAAMKLEAERVCQEMVARGLPVTILRPTLVHGPFSETWTIAYAQRLQASSWLVPESDAQGTCNLVYVDDLVGAVIAALDADVESGEAFNINGPDRPTWNEYFHALNDGMGLEPLVPESKSRARVSAMAMQPVRMLAKFALKHFESQIMEVYQKSEFARSIMKKAEGKIRTTPVLGEFAEYSRDVEYSTEKARAQLGYEPQFPISEAIPLTAAWLKHHGFVAGSTGAGQEDR